MIRFIDELINLTIFGSHNISRHNPTRGKKRMDDIKEIKVYNYFVNHYRKYIYTIFGLTS